MSPEPFIGVISDTHGQLRPEAVAALRGAALIIHGGDVGEEAILDRLAEIAPVHAVRGNVDYGPITKRLPMDEVVNWRGKQIYVYHILDDLPLDPAESGFDAVVYGHSHKPAQEEKGGVLYFNPGSAGPRRFNLPVSVGRLYLREAALVAEIVVLDPA